MRKFLKISGIVFLLFFLLFLAFLWRIRVPLPEIHSTVTPAMFKRMKTATNAFRVQDCWLRKNRFGIWEMYIEGDAYQRGVIYGVLAKELMERQEAVFVNQIDELIPVPWYQNFLKLFVAWFNRDLYKYIPEENKKEIYGISLSFSDRYDYVGPKYHRILNYHAAHDIGHALNDFSLVGCTSFAVNHEFTEDSSLLVGRNFDFYMGDDFAREKLLLFVNPDSGYKFASYSWAGFTGVVSGINEKGITVTINAAKSDIPYASKEPIALLAREILQYAGNIEEANAIAHKHDIFVSESLLIGSAPDNKAALIEKSPSKTGIYRPVENQLICANHYQSNTFKKDPQNIFNLRNSDSKYRFERMKELIQQLKPLNPASAAMLLRNTKGLHDKNIGLGNPKSINQLLGHHSIIFQPAKKLFWISTSDYQLGSYICYDFDKAFTNSRRYVIDSLESHPDPLLYTSEYSAYKEFRNTLRKINKFVLFDDELTLSDEEIEKYIALNPESYLVYESGGNYYKKKKEYKKAITCYQNALQREVPSNQEARKIKESMTVCAEKIKE